MFEWIDEDARLELNYANGETYSSFNQLQHKIAQKIMQLKNIRVIKLWCLQIPDEKHWQCVWDLWKSIATNGGWYDGKFAMSKTPRIRVVCVMSFS